MRVHVWHTCMRYMLQLCLHVRTGTQYRYCIHVCNTGTQYMSPVCLHVRTCIAYMYNIHVCDTCCNNVYTCVPYDSVTIHVCDTGIAYRYARVNVVLNILPNCLNRVVLRWLNNSRWVIVSEIQQEAKTGCKQTQPRHVRRWYHGTSRTQRSWKNNHDVHAYWYVHTEL